MPRYRMVRLTMKSGRAPLSIGARLFLLLLMFGALPLAAAIAAGYLVASRTVTEQGERALLELGERQATHVATELRRQRLLLRTIAAQFSRMPMMRMQSALAMADDLAKNLPEGGVFDGLRLVGPDGDVTVAVAVADSPPRWPDRSPAADWSRQNIAVHWENGTTVAYLLAVPIGASWLEGHVRSQDFSRLFDLPTHMMGEAESALYTGTGRLIVVSHEHQAGQAPVLAPSGRPDTVTIEPATHEDTESLVVAAPVAGTDWVFVAALQLADVLAPIARLRTGAILGFALLVILIAITANLAARSIARPMRDLATVARRLGRGESYEAVRTPRVGELALLVDAFNTMAADLQRSKAEIDELHNQELERAQQLATVGELASGVAHEIRNPLTGVLGALDLSLRHIHQEDSAHPLLEEAQKQLKRIEETTEQLLRYARPPQLREVLLDPVSLVERAVNVVQAPASQAGVHIEVLPSDESCTTRADPELMIQVLVNLMLNGIQAMGTNGKLTIWVECHGPELWIGVRDAGPGIPPSVRGEVFRPFYTTKHQGTGLGLSISKQIVERHDGSLRIEETPGGGTTVVIALPLIPDEDTTA
jgi:signal transduction histidine kinase